MNKEGLIADCRSTLAAAEGAIAWFADNPALLRQEAPLLTREFRRHGATARRLLAAVERPMCVGVFGPSQSGKSYLISALARSGTRPLVAEFDGFAPGLDFVRHINPENNRESTGLVTRFSIHGRPTPPGYPVALKLLSQTDLVKILGNTYFSDCDLSEASDPLKKARGAAVLAQLRSTPDTPRSEPTWLFREEALPLVVDMVRNEDDPMVLGSGIAALGHLDDPSAVPIIASYTDHPDEDVRFSVACALGSFPNDPLAIAGLLALTRDEDSEVRDWAVFGLGVLGDTDSVEIREALLERVTDDDEDVREEALVGLGKRRDPRLLPILRSLLDAPELKLRVAEAASAMLGLADDPEKWEAEDYKKALDQAFGPSSV